MYIFCGFASIIKKNTGCLGECEKTLVQYRKLGPQIFPLDLPSILHEFISPVTHRKMQLIP